MKKVLCIIVLAFFNNIVIASDGADNQAVNFINDTSDKVIKIIQSDLDTAAKQSSLTNIFLETMDVDWIGKFTVGRYWNALNDAEKTKYLQVYRRYLISSYVPLFKKYNGQKLVIKEQKKMDNGKYIVVTEITEKESNQSYTVEYRLQFTNNVFKVRDIIAEGLSLLATQRSEFASIMGQGGVDMLMEKLNDKMLPAE